MPVETTSQDCPSSSMSDTKISLHRSLVLELKKEATSHFDADAVRAVDSSIRKTMLKQRRTRPTAFITVCSSPSTNDGENLAILSKSQEDPGRHSFSSLSNHSLDFSEEGSSNTCSTDIEDPQTPGSFRDYHVHKVALQKVESSSSKFIRCFRNFFLLIAMACTLMHITATKIIWQQEIRISRLEYLAGHQHDDPYLVETSRVVLARPTEDSSAPVPISGSAGHENNSIDYQQFWQTAWEDAQVSLVDKGDLGVGAEQEEQPCPKVFVYNLSSTFHDTNSSQIASRWHSFGRVTMEGWGGLLRDTVQHHIGVIFEHRLAQPDNCYHTDDPTEADLFFVPVLLQRKKAAEWASICQNLNVTALLEELDNLTPATSCQHFFVFPKGHYSSEHCQGWFTDPHPRLQNAMRLAYSDVPGKADDPDLMYFTKASTRPDEDRKRHPNLVSIPYPSSLHWPGKSTKVTTNIVLSSNNNMTPTAMSRPVDNMFPAVNDPVSNATYINETLLVPLNNMSLLPSNRYDPQDRPFLMSYVGSFDHGDVQVRQQIQRQCESYYKDDPTICHLPPSKIQRRSSLPSQDILIKAQSIFCLEPAGDSPWRKGVADSITFGCIPVLFSDLSDQVTPWHWGDWKARGRVLVDRQAFVQGKIDLRHLLSSIPSQLLSLMQETLQQRARQYQYSLRDDDPYDAFHLTMTKMKEHSQSRMEEPGKCGGGT